MLLTKAYAKINLGLNIINKDSQDAYHNLDMVIAPIELHDRIEIELSLKSHCYKWLFKHLNNINEIIIIFNCLRMFKYYFVSLFEIMCR